MLSLLFFFSAEYLTGLRQGTYIITLKYVIEETLNKVGSTYFRQLGFLEAKKPPTCRVKRSPTSGP